MKKRILLIKSTIAVLFFCTCFSALGQNSSQKDTLSNYTFEELSEKFYTAKPDSLKAVLYAKYHINKARKEKDTLQIGSGYYFLSDITRDSTYYVNYWNQIIRATRSTNNTLYPTISYFKIGDFFFHKGEKEIALNNYLRALNSVIKTPNDSLKAFILTRIGMSKYRNKEYSDAIELYKKSLIYFNKEKYTRNETNEHISLLLNLSSTHKYLKQYDSAFFYNKKAYLTAIKFDRNDIIGYLTNSSGGILYMKKDYSIAIDSLKKSIPYIIDDENYPILSTSFYSIGKSYLELHDINNATTYFLKVDSLHIATNNYLISQKPAYKYLISYYKKDNNDKKQLEYINKYIKVDSVLNARAKSIAKDLTDNYDIPNLLAERKLIEDRLKGSLSNTKKWIIRIALVATFLLLFLISQIRKRKRYKKRFQQLLEASNDQINEVNPIFKKESNTIPKHVKEQILVYLETFENKQLYISSKITLSSLAKEFETNSKYLSQVINQNIGKTFSNYINSLRISYTVERLKTDKRFRKYSVQGISEEVGFNNSESFSKAFYKNTGIKPSYFIKELEKQQ